MYKKTQSRPTPRLSAGNAARHCFSPACGAPVEDRPVFSVLSLHFESFSSAPCKTGKHSAKQKMPLERGFPPRPALRSKMYICMGFCDNMHFFVNRNAAGLPIAPCFSLFSSAVFSSVLPFLQISDAGFMWRFFDVGRGVLPFSETIGCFPFSSGRNILPFSVISRAAIFSGLSRKKMCFSPVKRAVLLCPKHITKNKNVPAAARPTTQKVPAGKYTDTKNRDRSRGSIKKHSHGKIPRALKKPRGRCRGGAVCSGCFAARAEQRNAEKEGRARFFAVQSCSQLWKTSCTSSSSSRRERSRSMYLQSSSEVSFV